MLLRKRITELIEQLARKHTIEPFQLKIRYGGPLADNSSDADRSSPGRTAADAASSGSGSGADRATAQGKLPEFISIDPSYRLDQVALPAATMDRLLDCISFVEVVPRVFDDWGLRQIEPHPSIAVNFRGPPGTGKTMAAHAAAHHLSKKIMLSRLSDLESKYHGQGPKNLVGLFKSAADQDAVLFVDEAEALLSRRFAQPDQAAESAINSMRTELLMALDSFDGLVIFATNLPHSYDVAIESRLLHVDFDLPDRAARQVIWRTHLPGKFPLDPQASLERLVDIEAVSGRDIKLAVISAAVRAARKKSDNITESMLVESIERQRSVRDERHQEHAATDKDVAEKVRARLRLAGDTDAPSADDMARS